ncbi:MAG: hypothetical protein GX267_07840 [Fibrobacter sp.]|jgi:type IV pilus assembly protein PilQ|nr:hypothetical protein [Fibrobacter sp.]
MNFKVVWRINVIIMLCLIGFEANSQSSSRRHNEKRIDLFEVHNAEIHSVFKQLSAFSGVDIIAGEAVKGTVSLSVSNKSWREILTILCRINNLAAVDEGTYFYVVPANQLSKGQQNESASTQTLLENGTLKREIVQILHIPANEMKTSIEELLSARGKITVVAHTNSLIIYDTEENVDQIKSMISQLDVETAQISISCKIIEVSSGAIQRMGVHWGYADPSNKVEGVHIPEKTNIISGALERISYGVISPDKFDVTLEYLFNDNKGEIVAQPQITTLDNKEARIFMGQQVPVKYLDEAGNTVVQMVNAGTELVVKPHISGNGRILLELSPRKESYTLQDGVPIINEQSASTNVVVSNGETVVIAGLTSNETQKSESGIPVLKNIPLLGNLFKRSENSMEKKDLVIFVTPYIIQQPHKSPQGGH